MAGLVFPAELRTERLLLRQWRPEDAEPLGEVYAQPEYRRHMPPVEPGQARTHIERFERRWREDGYSPGGDGAARADLPRDGALARLRRRLVRRRPVAG